METADWRPTARFAVLQLRARFLATIRSFFARRGVLEVETPVLAASTATDIHIASLETRYGARGRGATGEGVGESGRRFFLQSSPEFAMKRLLAAGSGSIYQIGRAFRDGEQGRLHNPEFTLIEWYRIGFDHLALMDEVAALLDAVLGPAAVRRVTYRDAFRRSAGVDPFTSPLTELRARATELGVEERTARTLERDACLDLMLATCVQPALGKGRVFMHDFPASQASLARIRPGEPEVAERFELFVDGIEIANGYHELGDAPEQRARFEADRAHRRRLGLAEVPLDERLLAALARGLPGCAGVALGLDRLLMAAIGADSIDEVLAFPLRRA